MRLYLLVSMVLASSSGCIASELINQPRAPGGAITVQVNGSNVLMTTGLADFTVNPAVVNGYSPIVVFGLVAEGDSAGGSARTDLKQPGDTVTLYVGVAGTQLQISAGGMRCVSTTGAVHVYVEDGDNLSGDFQATGTLAGSSTSCAVSGALAHIPIQR
jgi:hypothetical protein